jgi:hypothetical protein
VFGALALGFTKFHQFQLAFHGFGLVAAVIDAFARRALQLNVWFLFCGHVDSLKRKAKNLK